MSGLFRARVDRRCQRGMHWIYEVDPAADPGRLAGQLARQAPLVTGQERWGSREVTRLIRQFRYEIRLGTADGTLSFIHRATASADQREADRRWFEGQLVTWLGGAAR